MRYIALLTAAALTLGATLPAAAQIKHHDFASNHASAYVTGGITAVGGSVTRLRGAAGVLSIPLRRLEAVPGARPQVSFEAPLSNNQGRYAFTGELVTEGNTFAGLGAGVGRLKVNGSTGLVYSAIAGTKIAPNTDLVGRFYVGSKNGMGTTGLVGLRLAIP